MAMNSSPVERTRKIVGCKWEKGWRTKHEEKKWREQKTDTNNKIRCHQGETKKAARKDGNPRRSHLGAAFAHAQNIPAATPVILWHSAGPERPCVHCAPTEQDGGGHVGKSSPPPPQFSAAAWSLPRPTPAQVTPLAPPGTPHARTQRASSPPNQKFNLEARDPPASKKPEPTCPKPLLCPPARLALGRRGAHQRGEAAPLSQAPLTWKFSKRAERTVTAKEQSD